MLSRTLVLRSLSILLCAASGGVYALSVGLVTLPSAAQAQSSILVQATPPAAPPLAQATPGPDVILAQAQPIPTPAPDPDTVETVALSPFGLPCDVNISATSAPAAMIAIDILAPCQPETEVTIQQAGLTVRASTDMLGLLTLDIPGFETPTSLTVTVGDTEREDILVPLSDIARYDRVALIWQPPAAMALHAMEFGARFGDPGHVWAENPQNPAVAIEGLGGFLTQLGTPDELGGTIAHIYTFPRETLTEEVSVTLSIDAEITETNCGLPAEAHTLRSTAGTRSEVTPIRFTHPGCDSVGEFLVLQNLLPALTVSSN